ncbi:MAG: MBL fold metallo-hydrolase [Betaproteobacteria bacterium]|nr:MBL fold metallo-hydrolase [Betaproteobacteria bacterium]
MSRILDFDHGISAIDSEYLRPGLDAIHLIVEGSRAAVVDAATTHSVPRVLEALEAKGLSPQNVEFIFLTHVHLDHAGGAGALARALPEARIVVHPRGLRHMADPSKLVAGAAAVYGEEAVRAMYGDIPPVDPARLVEATDGFSASLNGRPFLFLDTPGHARHHNVIWDEHSGCMFTGDIFGMSYRELDVDGREFVFPTSSPSQFDPEAAHASIERIMSYHPRQAFLTHFSRVTQLDRHAAALHRLLDDYVGVARACRSRDETRHRCLAAGMERLLLKRIRAHGCTLPESALLDIIGMDVELNAQGLASWLDGQRSPET